jgi:hypothetical protein
MNSKLLKLDPILQMVLQQRIKDSSPNGVVAYILLVFLGLVGGHIYYMAYKAEGGLRTAFIILGLVYTFTFAMGGVMWFLDLFLLMMYLSMVRKENEDHIVNEYLKRLMV